MQSWTLPAGLTGLFVIVVSTMLIGSPTVLSQTESGRVDVEGGRLQIVSTLLPTGVQQLVVLDREDRALAVYHVEPAQGKIQLKSVRRIVWDLKMEQFNADAPLPGELRNIQP